MMLCLPFCMKLRVYVEAAHARRCGSEAHGAGFDKPLMP
jgi:hypothetical protein